MSVTTREQEIVDLETRFWNAIRDNDASVASTLVSETCLLTGAQGHSAINRGMFAKMMDSPSWALHEFTLTKPEVLFPSDDVAIIAYTVTEKLTVEGKPVTLQAADASTWVHQGGRWLCALHTESVLGDPFGRDRRTGS